MRAKLVILAVALFAMATGVATSEAALQNAVQAKLHFKKAGGPGSIFVQLVNMDDVPLPTGRPLSKRGLHNALYDGGLVPQRLSRLVVQSSSVRYNRRALPTCRVVFRGQAKIPTRADGITGAEELTYVPGERNSHAVKKACPKKSILGRGTFTATVGTPGLPYNPAQAGALEGTVIIYNYRPKKGDTLGTVARLHVDNPVPSTQYLYAGVSRRGVLIADVPRRTEIPTNLDATIPPGELSMTSLSLDLKAPRPKRHRGRAGKPIFTIKSFKKLDVYGQLVRE
jgi:hypothetical protein